MTIIVLWTGVLSEFSGKSVWSWRCSFCIDRFIFPAATFSTYNCVIDIDNSGVLDFSEYVEALGSFCLLNTEEILKCKFAKGLIRFTDVLYGLVCFFVFDQGNSWFTIVYLYITFLDKNGTIDGVTLSMILLIGNLNCYLRVSSMPYWRYFTLMGRQVTWSLLWKNSISIRTEK